MTFGQVERGVVGEHLSDAVLPWAAAGQSDSQPTTEIGVSVVGFCQRFHILGGHEQRIGSALDRSPTLTQVSYT